MPHAMITRSKISTGAAINCASCTTPTLVFELCWYRRFCCSDNYYYNGDDCCCLELNNICPDCDYKLMEADRMAGIVVCECGLIITDGGANCGDCYRSDDEDADCASDEWCETHEQVMWNALGLKCSGCLDEDKSDCASDEWCETHEQVMWKDGLKCSGCLDEDKSD